MRFSRSAEKLRASEIRELMKLAADPSIISFSGGMPNNDLFPIEAIDTIYAGLSDAAKKTACQYGPTDGYPALKESLTEYLRSRGLPVDTNKLLITTGAQQAMNLLAKVFLDEGDKVICEFPSFVGSVAAFNSYGAQNIGIELDEEGINIAKLRDALTSGELAKILYLIPYFQNPAGTIYSAKRKQEIIDLLKEFPDLILLEDDPYGELWFNEEDLPLTTPMKAITQDSSQICYVGTFAKILGPGFRIGYMLVPDEIYNKCELAKQSQDACTSTYTQVLADQYLRNGALQPYLDWLRPIYKRRAEIMLSALETYMPQEVVWTKPKGGFFIWATLPEYMDSSEVFALAVKEGAAFVVGRAFDPEGKKNNAIRLAFSHTAENRIEEGIKIVADAVKKLLK